MFSFSNDKEIKFTKFSDVEHLCDLIFTKIWHMTTNNENIS